MLYFNKASFRNRILFLGLVCILPLQLGWRYAEDVQTRGIGPHSTFHYELTRTLARAAGFSADEAERIAVLDEATDAQDFTGETGISMQIRGTGRNGDNALYWHFARRGAGNATGEYTYPGARNTCDYFVDSDPCPGGEPELAEIESWAVYGDATPAPGTPQLSRDGGATFEDVPGRSPEALGLYLHSLADSYSHEACMREAHFRGHKPLPQECSAIYWHEQAEYGHRPRRDNGVEYTREAAWATWLALKWFRQQNHLPGEAVWSDAQAQDFIENWIQLNRGQKRRDAAVQALQGM